MCSFYKATHISVTAFMDEYRLKVESAKPKMLLISQMSDCWGGGLTTSLPVTPGSYSREPWEVELLFINIYMLINSSSSSCWPGLVEGLCPDLVLTL